MHAVLPDADVEPSAQKVHAEAPSLPEYLPAAQLMHSAPEKLDLPAAQLAHAVSLTYCPAEHDSASQEDAPSADEKPLAQALQADAALKENVPAAQKKLPLPFGQYLPTVQYVQEVALIYCPNEHVGTVQNEAPGGDVE